MPGPTFKNLPDGYQTLITFQLANFTTLQLYEKEITPPGYDMGGPIDQTTMRNVLVRTRAPKSLVNVDQAEGTFAYNPSAYPQVFLLMGVKQLIIITFPNNATYSFFGWIERFKPNSNKEGEQPTAQVIIEPSNLDLNGNEYVPLTTAGVY